MEFRSFLKAYQHLPVLKSKFLLTGEPNPAVLRVQLARWVKAGHLVQLKRGIYIFADPFRKLSCPETFLASVLLSPSYVSLEKALEYHKMIPEAVFTVTCVTTKRPGSFATLLGRFDYSHVQPRLFWGYGSVSVDGQQGFMAHPEKALLDLFYLRSPRISEVYLDELRLQNLEKINSKRLIEYSHRFGKPPIFRAAQTLVTYMTASRKKERRP